MISRQGFEYALMGFKKPSIVFLNGFRMKFDTWNQVHTILSDRYEILLYNRLSVGQSKKALQHQLGKVIVDQLRDLLAELDITPPYLLVGHSLGGLYANLYARTYPDEVSGVVFVDAPHPEEIAAQRLFTAPLPLRVINEGVKKIEKLFDKYKHSEDECIDETVLQITQAGDFPAIPVAVLSGAKKMPFVPQAAFDIHLEYQKELLKLAPYTTQYVCNESGHFVQVTEPEVVIAAIDKMVLELAQNEHDIYRSVAL
ncbi:2-succinyl-6-hydroxy-2, 4-cyclohexadiene-1-carboxylate synthase [Pseudoalteromonas sp. CIP111854]|uniref:2-succinyl-6-hydroxy-2, 4-cyclohexadiene-1-carboxylate synthase n=1 Tax=Pseudoalteromonas holothuriae TaxID=2963714 RepID=A0A9W4QRU3_9GAMM|nr:alpha/beta hydrolase [Pseudoalteromonas sp. CIP111854]CAH9050318.1 2-succinyl-6-hydroxy-2, 4-cyclohexadiene-1-carboxylate synthase [Pseudoalteromonas sp. CIP111854]